MLSNAVSKITLNGNPRRNRIDGCTSEWSLNVCTQLEHRLLGQVAMTNSQPTQVMKPAFAREELPLRVRDAAVFLGVSPQTVYLWVERKQIPHLRVMGRNIRFLKSELEPFRAQFKQEVENWQDQ